MPKQQQLELACLGALGHQQHVACDPTLARGWRERRRDALQVEEDHRGSGNGKGESGTRVKEGGKGGDVWQERGIWETAPSQTYRWALGHCLRVQAADFPRQPLITAVPHVPLQERKSRYITGDVGGAPPGLRFITARQTLCER